MLIGYGLRRGELLGLRVHSIHLREERWVIADLPGKAGPIRTVPIPSWVKTTVEKWKEASGNIVSVRSIDRRGLVWGNRYDTQSALGNREGGCCTRGRFETRAERSVAYLRQALSSCRWSARPHSVSVLSAGRFPSGQLQSRGSLYYPITFWVFYV